MRELVYLSERKLRQFAVGRPQRWRSRARIAGEIKIPGVGGITVSPAGDGQGSSTVPNLDKVITSLESTDRAARWFADDVQAGQWVHFEAPLSYATIGAAVIFLDLNRPTTTYPTGGVIRLMLHGSREHLVGSVLPPRVSHRGLGMSSGSVLNLVTLLEDSLEPELDSDGPGTSRREVQTSMGNTLRRLITALDNQLELPHTAAWMAGHARVTARFPGLVLATPLYVEYISTPSPAD